LIGNEYLNLSNIVLVSLFKKYLLLKYKISFSFMKENDNVDCRRKKINTNKYNTM